MRSQPPFGYVRRAPAEPPDEAVIGASANLGSAPVVVSLALDFDTPGDYGGILTVSRVGGTVPAEVSWTTQTFGSVVLDSGASGTLNWDVDDFADKTITINASGAADPFSAWALFDFVAVSGCSIAIPGGTMSISLDTVPDGSAACTLVGF